MPRRKLTTWEKDFRRLRVLAREIIEQAGHYERNTANGGTDEIRALLVRPRTDAMAKIGRRMEKRWRRQNP